jgi:hypothetical protein
MRDICTAVAGKSSLTPLAHREKGPAAHHCMTLLMVQALVFCAALVYDSSPFYHGMVSEECQRSTAQQGDEALADNPDA